MNIFKAFQKKRALTDKEKMTSYIERKPKASVKKIDDINSFILYYRDANKDLSKNGYTTRSATVQESSLASACMAIACLVQSAELTGFNQKIQYGRQGLNSQWEFISRFLDLLDEPEVAQAIWEARKLA